MINYNCRTHGDWDASRASGCPDCMVEARKTIAVLREACEAALFEWNNYETIMDSRGKLFDAIKKAEAQS